MTPPITREAREWLRDCLVRMGGSSEGDTAYQTGVRHTTEALRQKLYSMPTSFSSTDPLDAVRARFSLEEHQDITATDGDYVLGYNDNYVTVWRAQDGAHWLGYGPARPLQPASPHSALIAGTDACLDTARKLIEEAQRLETALHAIRNKQT